MMKRKTAFFVLLAVLFLFSCGEDTCNGSGCCAKFGEFANQGLDAGTERQILMDSVKYLNIRYDIKDQEGQYTMCNTSIWQYHGIFNEFIVVTFSAEVPHWTVGYDYCFSGIRISDGPGSPILAWQTGSIYTLPEVWDSELLNKTDIKNISQEKYGNIWWCAYPYSPLPDCKHKYKEY